LQKKQGVAMSYMSRKIVYTCLALCVTTTSYAEPANDYVAYCNSMTGIVHSMTVDYSTNHGIVHGFSKDFCQFHVDNGTIEIGLETYASQSSNIAASYMKTLPTIDENSDLFKGSYTNPSYNVCNNLHGVMVGFVTTGSFADSGQSDVCVFGDGSMVSAWSLIYMANHRDGYDAIKNSARSEPLDLQIQSNSGH
jgi:hypothetical protein